MLSQSFGDISEDMANEADTVTAVEFDHDGQNLATGDRGGRIVVFKYADNTKKSLQHRRHGGEGSSSNHPETYLWSPFFQFQSHDTEFDYLKSIEIEERVNQIKFCKPIAGNLFLLSTNDKTIKLWKVADRPQYTSEAVYSVQKRGVKSFDDLPLPKPKVGKNDLGIANSTVAIPKRLYKHAHAYHINSLSINSDGETFLSADDLAVNLWNFERSDCSFHIVDIKPPQMEELSEVITCAQFHPLQCNLLTYATSKGVINLCDLRQASTFDRHPPSSFRSGSSITSTASSSTSTSPRIRSSTTSSHHSGSSNNYNNNSSSVRCFRPEEEPFKSNFSEILSSISDLKFTRDGRYMVSRDYMTVKIWDLNMDSKPVTTIPVHNNLKSMLPSLYESDAIFDKFEVFLSPTGDKIITGTYSNRYFIYNMNGSLDSTIQLPTRQSSNESFSSVLTLPDTATSPTNIGDSIVEGANEFINTLKNLTLSGNSMTKPNRFMTEPLRIDQKILHGSWHPSLNVVAIAGQTGLYMYKV